MRIGISFIFTYLTFQGHKIYNYLSFCRYKLAPEYETLPWISSGSIMLVFVIGLHLTWVKRSSCKYREMNLAYQWEVSRCIAFFYLDLFIYEWDDDCINYLWLFLCHCFNCIWLVFISLKYLNIKKTKRFMFLLYLILKHYYQHSFSQDFK